MPNHNRSRSPLRALLLLLSVLALVLPLGLTAPAHADRQTFTDRRDDVPTGNDIRSVRVNYDFDLNVTLRLKGLPRGQIAAYFDGAGTNNQWDYIWFGSLGGAEDFAFYDRAGWRNDTPLDCDYDYVKNRESASARLFISGDCFATEYDAIRLYAGTSWYNRKTDNYTNIDWAPGPRGTWYPYVDNG